MPHAIENKLCVGCLLLWVGGWLVGDYLIHSVHLSFCRIAFAITREQMKLGTECERREWCGLCVRGRWEEMQRWSGESETEDSRERP